MNRFLSLLLCLSLLLSLTACAAPAADITDPSTAPAATEAPTEPTPPTVEAVYADAARAVEDAACLELSATVNKRVSFGTEVHTQSSTQHISIQNYGTDNLICAVEDSTTLGSYLSSSTEFYSDGTAYLLLDSLPFSAQMEPGDYLARFVPAVLLSEGLYTTVSEETDSAGNTVISFTAPTEAEHWAMPAEGILQSASGKATLNNAGALVKSCYSLTYSYGPAQITQETTVSVAYPENLNLRNNIPVAEDAYTQLEYLDAPMLLNRAIYNIHEANSLSATVTGNMTSGFSHDILYTRDQAATFRRGEELLASLQQNRMAENPFSDPEVTKSHLSLIDGVCTLSENDSEPEAQDLTDAQIQERCISAVADHLWSAEYLKSAAMTDLGSVFRLDFGGNDALAELLTQKISAAFYADEAFLTDMANSGTVETLEAVLTIDKYTGYPVYYQSTFKAAYAMDGRDCALSETQVIQFLIGSARTHEVITGTPAPDALPETPATPLFYRVTGAGDQELWLLGTIHIGDNRTAHLPQEIYDALAASDALAVECDTVNATKKLESDPAFAQSVLDAYFYSDKTTLQAHMASPALYESTVDFLKATGMYDNSTEVSRMFLLEQLISGFYTQQSYALYPEKGADQRLIRLAMEQGLEIREIESVEKQAWLFAGFTEELQEWMLLSTLSQTSAAYNAADQELYNLWCAGDETALREYLRTDYTGLTEQEQILQKEYDYAMIQQRNATMLETAFEYLLSGETVFYAVGLAHLLQGNGLVDALRSAGYTVEPVLYN